MDTAIPITVRPWLGTDQDGFGHHPASSYVELFWLPTVGPTATWLYRRLAAIAAQNGSTSIEIIELAAQLGVGDVAIRKTLDRLAYFGLLRQRSPIAFDVRMMAPRLRSDQVSRLSDAMRVAHAQAERSPGWQGRALMTAVPS